MTRQEVTVTAVTAADQQGAGCLTKQWTQDVNMWGAMQSCGRWVKGVAFPVHRTRCLAASTCYASHPPLLLLLLLAASAVSRPSLSEMLKWGWVQFACTFWLAYWLISRLEGLVLQYRVLETRVISDMQSRTQRY